MGFWFSLGHSTVVFGLALLLSIGVKTLAGQVGNDASELHAVTGIIGASVSGVFLWILDILNLVVLLGRIEEKWSADLQPGAAGAPDRT